MKIILESGTKIDVSQYKYIYAPGMGATWNDMSGLDVLGILRGNPYGVKYITFNSDEKHYGSKPEGDILIILVKNIVSIDLSNIPYEIELYLKETNQKGYEHK